MPARHLPVRPNLEQLRHQAKELLRAIRVRDAEALADLRQYHPAPPDPDDVRLHDAQLVLARSYEAPSWPRLVRCCELIDAIWRDDVETVRQLVLRHPEMLHEDALVRPSSSWGPPMSYAANLGRDTIITMLRDLGANDFEKAIDRAALQGQVRTARLLWEMAGRPRLSEEALGGPAYTVNAAGTAFLLELGARVCDDDGKLLAPVWVVLESDSRKPAEKHRILEMYVEHGARLPDTPTMALHRGRIDLLEEHLRRDPALLSRTFSHEEIYPPELGCHDPVMATHGTTLHGTTLLHMCCDYGELEIARWLLARGADVNAKASVDADGFGGHTPLFNTVVSQVNYWPNQRKLDDPADFTRLLLDHGADPNARASLRKQVHPGYFEDTLHEYPDVTPLSWGRRFHFKLLVSETALRMIEERGGQE